MVEPSLRIRDVDGHDVVAEGAVELPSDIPDVHALTRLDADWMAQAVVRTGRVRAKERLVADKHALNRGANGDAAFRGRRLDLHHASALLVQQTRMAHVADARDPISPPDVLIEACSLHAALAALGLRPTVDELVALDGLPLPHQGDLGHEAPRWLYAPVGLKPTVDRRSDPEWGGIFI